MKNTEYVNAQFENAEANIKKLAEIINEGTGGDAEIAGMEVYSVENIVVSYGYDAMFVCVYRKHGRCHLAFFAARYGGSNNAAGGPDLTIAHPPEWTNVIPEGIINLPCGETRYGPYAWLDISRGDYGLRIQVWTRGGFNSSYFDDMVF